MNCKKVKNYFSLLLDKELDQNQTEALMLHLDQCQDCAREWQQFQQISVTLNEIGKDVMSAPDSFSCEVMDRIRMESKVKRTGAFRRWKTAMAGTAAAFLLVFGSLSIIPGLLDSPEINIAEDPGSKNSLPPDNNPAVIPGEDNNGDPDTSGDPPPQDNTQPNTNENNNTEENLLDILKTAKPDNSGEANNPPSQEKPDDIAAQTFAEVPEPVLLDKERTILTIGLKMDFTDPAEAVTKVQEGAAAAGGSIEPLGQKAEGGASAYKIVVPAESYKDYLDSICGLGTLLSRQEEKEDITSHYSELLQQYGVLGERLQAAEDEHEKMDLEGQKRSLEQQLFTWDKESNQVTIVLWL